jgi:serine protein kinase
LEGEQLSGRVEGQEYNLFDDLANYSSEREKLRWEGSFDEFVETKLVENPEIAKNAHKRTRDAVAESGYFTSGPDALYGMEEPLDRFKKLLEAGGQGSEVGRRIYLFVGPHGGGKSSIINNTKRSMEDYSRKDGGASYAIKGCEMQEDPLHLIPKELRPRIEEQYGIHIEGDL